MSHKNSKCTHDVGLQTINCVYTSWILFFLSDFTYNGPYNSITMNSLAVNFSNAVVARYERYSILLRKVKPFYQPPVVLSATIYYLFHLMSLLYCFDITFCRIS